MSTSFSTTQFVMGSGQAIGMTAAGAITSVSVGNDIQTITLSGGAANGTSPFALTFNGQTTANVAITPSAPGGSNGTYGLYTIPVTIGTEIQVSYNLTSGGGGNAEYALLQLFDGNTLVSDSVLNQYSGTPDFTVTDADGQGHTIYMKNVVTYTPTTSTLSIWVSTTNQSNPNAVICDCVGIKNVGTGTITYFDDSTPGIFTGSNLIGVGFDAYNGSISVGAPMSLGGVLYTVTASDILSALQALSNIGTGNVTVTGSNPFTVTFVGSLALATQPTITSANSGVTIAHSLVGGSPPTYTVTPQGGSPGSPIPLNTFIWGKTSQQAPYLLMPLPQSYPSSQYYFNGMGYAGTASHWSGATNRGLSNQAGETTTTGDIAQIYVQGAPPATYQIALTWVADSGLASSVPVTVNDTTGAALLLSTTVNQSVAPGSGGGDFSQDGYSWRVIGSFTTTSPSTGFYVTMTNPGGKIAFDTLLVTRTSSDISQKILATDTVSVNFPAGFIGTGEGSSAAFSGVIPNFGGGQTSFQPGGFGTVPSVTPTMKVGYNVTTDSYYNPCITFTDLSGRLGGFSGTITSDANGYPTLLSSQQPNPNPLVLTQNAEYGVGLGQAAAPYGYWTVQWDDTEGSGDLLALASTDSLNEVMSYRNYTGTTKQRVFNVQPTAGSGFAPTLRLTLISGSSPNGSGQYPVSINNFHIYPPNPSDSTGMTPYGILGGPTPPRFWPNFVDKLAGAKQIRFMDWNGANAGQTAEIGDFRQPGMLGGALSRIVTTAVTSIAPATSPYQFDNTAWVILEITTATPSGIENLIAGTVTFTGTIELSNGQTITGAVGGVCSPISPTVFQLQVGYSSEFSNVSMTNTLTGSFSFARGYTTPHTLVDCVTLCNQIGADCWLSLPTTMTNTGFTAVAEYMAANLNRGLKQYIEFGNECWNDGLASWRLCVALTQQLTSNAHTGPEFGQVIRGAVCHAAFVTAFTAAGRASDVIRVVGSQASQSYVTGIIISAATAYSITFDALATAPYFDPNDPLVQENEFQNNYDLMTPYGAPGNINDGTGGQATDWYELMAVYGGDADLYVGQHRTVLNNAGLTNVNVVCYEGGPQVLTPNGSTVNSAYRSHVVGRHPRAYQWMLARLQGLQEAGATVFCDYYVCGPNDSVPPNGYPNQSFFEWSIFNADNQGVGTGTLDDTVNATNPEQIDQLLSEPGGGIYYWSSLIGAATGYAVSGINSNVTVGTSYTITATLNGPASSSGVITFGATSGVTWGGSISISSGSSSGSTTLVFNEAGIFNLTVSHTGLGFSGNPTLTEATAAVLDGPDYTNQTLIAREITFTKHRVKSRLIRPNVNLI